MLEIAVHVEFDKVDIARCYKKIIAEIPEANTPAYSAHALCVSDPLDAREL